MDLKWIKYFNKYIKNQKKNKYWILILNKYKNYKLITFQIYYIHYKTYFIEIIKITIKNIIFHLHIQN